VNPSHAQPQPRRRRQRASLAVAWIVGWILLPVLCTAGAPEDFRVRILPILTYAGCNTGACHGAATGQGGFKLSLLGYAPELDHAAITRELGGRRIDAAFPEQSLLLRKATRQIDHEGDRRFRTDSPEALELRAWIARGAPFGRPDIAVTQLHVEPALLRRSPASQVHPLTVVAHLSDGTSLAVTDRALYSSNDDSVAEVTRQGEVRILGPGTTAIMIRFAGNVAAVRVEHPFPGSSAPLPTDRSGPDHPVDRFVSRQLQAMNLPASPRSSATEFLRRIHLDLAGRLPTAEFVRRFLAGPDTPEVRIRVIDQLLASQEFTDLWTMRLADLLLISGKRGSERAATTSHQWLRSHLAADTGWDRMAWELLTTDGPVQEVGPASFALLANDPRDLAEHAASIFLGTRIGCARCHAHPADRWTRTDYHQFAAFFARIHRENGRVTTAARGEVEDPQSGRPLSPRALGEPSAIPDAGDRRKALAQWTTDPANPRFAHAFVNRVWKHLLGRGLVEPVDDLRPTNPPTHPELFDHLAHEFASHGFRLRPLVRAIVTSETYQRTSRTLPANDRDDRLLSHALLKSPDGRVLLDMIGQATGVPEDFPDQPDVTAAVQLVGTQTPSPALDILGRCARETACETTTTAGGGLAQALHLLNGQTVNTRLQRGNLPRWLATSSTPGELLDNLYLHTVSRLPSAAERTAWEPLLSGARRAETAADLLWALLNGREFTFNH
jgi:Protein of unknown function (DUF1553)/Protein of unknown function (DUF1549)